MLLSVAASPVISDTTWILIFPTTAQNSRTGEASGFSTDCPCSVGGDGAADPSPDPRGAPDPRRRLHDPRRRRLPGPRRRRPESRRGHPESRRRRPPLLLPLLPLAPAAVPLPFPAVDDGTSRQGGTVFKARLIFKAGKVGGRRRPASAGAPEAEAVSQPPEPRRVVERED